MMKVHCRTNLDDVGRENWPKELPALPNIGDYIVSGTVWNTSNVKNLRVRLKVVGITFQPDISYKNEDVKSWHPEIELHLPDNQFLHISHFELWYKYIQGRESHEYYCKKVEYWRDEIAREKREREEREFQIKYNLLSTGKKQDK